MLTLRGDTALCENDEPLQNDVVRRCYSGRALMAVTCSEENSEVPSSEHIYLNNPADNLYKNE